MSALAAEDDEDDDEDAEPAAAPDAAEAAEAAAAMAFAAAAALRIGAAVCGRANATSERADKRPSVKHESVSESESALRSADMA
jgi:hypothetical protein